MSLKFSVRHRNAWLMIGLATLIVVTFLLVFGPWFESHTGTAAWVQAFGSILVIAATAIIAGRNSREIQERDQLTRQQLKAAVAQLARSSINALDTFISDMKNTSAADPRGAFLRAYAPGDFEVPLDGLAQLPLHQIDDAVLIELILRLRGLMSRIKKHLDTVQTDPLLPASSDIAVNYRTTIFNAVAGILRLVETHPEPELSRLASR